MIKINLDKEDIAKLADRNGIAPEQLEANKDVKIGGLFLSDPQFIEKVQEKGTRARG